MQRRRGARQAMDALLSAVASDLIGRLVNFLVGKYQEPSATDTAVRLQRALLRARVVVEEAEGRQIANRAMLQQFIQLRRQLCRAAYALDAFRYRRTTVSRSRSRTRPPPSSDCSHVLSVMVESLEATLSDMRESVVLLSGCPRVTRQPYSTYLFMESCMFGRQMEKEEIIGFLWRPCQDLDVLPIIGPHDVGKRTLVEHVCLDERVRDRFAKIHRLSSDELDLRPHSRHKQRWSSLFDFTARSLTLIDIVDGDADVDESWRRFHSAARRHAHSESKIIVISRTEVHSSLGTVPPLRLRMPRREELWYFFRALAFGGADPDERPDLVRIAMALCAIITDVTMFQGASVIAASLRDDLSARSWRRVLKVFSNLTLMQLGAAGDGHYYLCGPAKETTGHYYLCRREMDALGACSFFCSKPKLSTVALGELPKVTAMDLLSGGSLPPAIAGKTRFDVVAWESRIPPYVAHVMTWDMEKSRQVLVVGGKKRARKRRSYQHDDHQRTRI